MPLVASWPNAYSRFPFTRISVLPHKRLLGILDHCAISLLIAGTYTPLCLTIFGGVVGWLLLGLVWCLATFWIVLKALVFVRMSSFLSNMIYISMGWLVVFFIAAIYDQLGAGAVLLMLGAGVMFTAGAVSFQWSRPNPFPPYFGNHEIWHVAVFVANGMFF